MSQQPPQLSKLSSYGRSLLEALGEDIQQHQKEVLARLRGTYVRQKEKPDPVLKSLQSDTVKISPSIAEAAAALDKRAALWREDAYCIFIAHCTCKGCGRKWTGQMDPNVYLRSKKTRKDESNPYIYVPVRSISNWSLPRLKVSAFYTLFSCDNCFEGLTPCQPTRDAPEPSSTPSQENTESLAGQLPSSAESFESSPVPVPPASTSEEGTEIFNLSQDESVLLSIPCTTSPSLKSSNGGFPALAEGWDFLTDWDLVALTFSLSNSTQISTIEGSP
jgi:hypothetical protein